MDVPKENDILLLADEKFDFDLSLSSSSANEDDEVFFGPVGHKERCVAASLELNHHIPEEPLLPASESHFIWSPLPGEKFVEVYKEAHLLALQIESKSKNKAAQDVTAEDLWSQGVERFIQESKLKISLFEKENEMKKSPKSLKRETYYLSDSPLRDLPLRGTQTPSGMAPTPAALAQAGTPEQGGPGRSSSSTGSQPSQLNTAGSVRRRDSYLLRRTQAVPTPTSQFKIPKFATGEPLVSATPKSCRAQRPQSCTSAGRFVVHSTPARRSSVAAPQSLVSSTRTPMSTKHVSALPTPASRRLSGLPFVTPKTVPRALASPLCVPARRLSSEPQKKSSVRAAPTRETHSKATSRREDSSPDGSLSPLSAVPQALNFSPEKTGLTLSGSISTEVVLDAAQPPGDTPTSEAILVDIKLDQLVITPKAESTALIDIPLIDFCNSPEAHVALGSESRPLIDLLINTPDMNRNTASKPPQEVGQLIDLASPLIQLSPEADKENMDSPLLKF
ncbi:PREDICTED: G2 and S phase-expressed protein 1 [Odobenus rosmarus divergens]|uniref:G2 and S phase-expressed protein 1 n=1 Tax=Odobenus rosmarus divergens TaxID=9708 RepID=A0A9B0M490_ODORO